MAEYEITIDGESFLVEAADYDDAWIIAIEEAEAMGLFIGDTYLEVEPLDEI